MGGDKELAWLHGEIQSPPFSERTRLRAGFLLRRLQQGDTIEPPNSKPMPSIGPRCHEIRLTDSKVGSTQARVAKIESDASDVSLDLMFRGLFAAGGSLEDLTPKRRPARQKTSKPVDRKSHPVAE